MLDNPELHGPSAIGNTLIGSAILKARRNLFRQCVEAENGVYNRDGVVNSVIHFKSQDQNLEKYSFRTRDHLPSPLSFSIFDRKDEDAAAEKKEGKPYEVSLVLAVVVKKLVGNMTVKIKEPLQTACGTPSPPSPNGDLN
ncbi:hypothetical protein M422DRAFT_245474 [Sphaerobolus stellatus SS14]|nr:hypothetical protein M422DRAFT_245474 [Sphaerobolus stellatus SS14]